MEQTIPVVSIIVAVYNSESTLKRCLDSLISQTLKNFEVLLIDDGSTDNSPAICDQYAQSDKRFKVFHKPNEGVSATRQFGLDRAVGEYVIHLDSDDYVDPRIYEEMYNEAIRKSADMVFIDMLRFEGGGNVTLLKNNPKSWQHKDVLDAMIYKLFGSLCNRLVKRDLFEKFDIRFPERMQYLEDKLILIKLLSRSYNAGDYFKFGYVPKAYYFYDTASTASSLTRVSAKEKFNNRFSYWKQAGEDLDMQVFGRTYYDLLLEYGFNVFWNRVLPEEEFIEWFSPYKDDIRHFASGGARKYLILLAITDNFQTAQKRRWVAYPLLLKDKIRIYKNKFESKRR